MPDAIATGVGQVILGVVCTVTVEVATPMFPAVSLKRNVTVVTPRGNTVELSMSMPLTCGVRRAGAGSIASLAEPPARNAERAVDITPVTPAGWDARTVIAAGGMTSGVVPSILIV